MPGIESILELNQPSISVKNCVYKEYRNEHDFKEFTYIFGSAICGMNPNSNLLCKMHQGDKVVKSLIKDIRAMFELDINCHIQHPIMFKTASGLNCKELVDKVGKYEANKFQILGMLLDDKFDNTHYI